MSKTWHAVIQDLHKRAPCLFQAPEFWRSDLADIRETTSAAIRGKHEVIGSSAGGRQIDTVCYGEREPVKSTATISSAMASDRPQSFFDPAARSKPVLALIGSMHGGETEGIVLCLNLIRLLETGRDFTEQERAGLVEKCRKVRLVIIPCLNPDGREAAAVRHLNGATLEDLFLVQQGILADGTLFRGRQVKETQPIPPDMMKFMGGYYNANGINLQHDDFFGPAIASENIAVRELFRREIPDAFLTMHAHGGAASFLTPDAYLAHGTQRKQVEAAGFILSKLQSHGIPFKPPEQIVTPPWSFFFQTWLHHMTGATPLLFEFCHGLAKNPCPLKEILQTGFVVFEAWLDYCLTFCPRPRSRDLFGEISPA